MYAGLIFAAIFCHSTGHKSRLGGFQAATGLSGIWTGGGAAGFAGEGRCCAFKILWGGNLGGLASGGSQGAITPKLSGTFWSESRKVRPRFRQIAAAGFRFSKAMCTVPRLYPPCIGNSKFRQCPICPPPPCYPCRRQMRLRLDLRDLRPANPLSWH